MPNNYQTPLYNEVDLEQALVAFEPAPGGTYTTPKVRWPYRIQIDGTRAQQDITTATGGFDRDVVMSQAGLEVTGTTGGDQANGAMAFEDLPILDRMTLGGTTFTAAVSDGGTPATYLTTSRPSPATNDLLSLSAEVGFRHGVRQAGMILINEETITIDPSSNGSWVYSGALIGRSLADKPLKVGTATAATTTVLTDSAAGLTPGAWVGAVLQVGVDPATYQEREVIANTATTVTVFPAFTTAPSATTPYVLIPDFTPGVVDYARELIPAAGTQIYLDDLTGTIGTTALDERWLNFSMTTQLNQKIKRFGENVDVASTRRGRGKRAVTVQLKMEGDRKRMNEALTEFQRANRRDQSLNGRKMRIRQAGPTEVRPGVTREVVIDLPLIRWTGATQDDNNGNRSFTLAGKAFLNTTAGYVVERRTRHTLAAIPA